MNYARLSIVDKTTLSMMIKMLTLTPAFAANQRKETSSVIVVLSQTLNLVGTSGPMFAIARLTE